MKLSVSRSACAHIVRKSPVILHLHGLPKVRRINHKRPDNDGQQDECREECRKQQISWTNRSIKRKPWHGVVLILRSAWNVLDCSAGSYPRVRSWVNTRRSEEHTSELQSLTNLVCRLLLEKKKK